MPTVLPVVGAVVSAGLAVWSAVDNGLPVLLRYVAMVGFGLLVWAVQRGLARTGLLDVDAVDGLEPEKIERMEREE